MGTSLLRANAVATSGKHGSAQAASRYREVLSEHLAGKVVPTSSWAPVKSAPGDWPKVGKLCLEFLLHARRFYVDSNGRETTTPDAFTVALVDEQQTTRQRAIGMVEV